MSMGSYILDSTLKWQPGDCIQLDLLVVHVVHLADIQNKRQWMKILICYYHSNIILRCVYESCTISLHYGCLKKN